MRYRYGLLYLILVVLLSLSQATQAQKVKRIVIIKADGLSGDIVDRFVRQQDAATGKSVLPWFEEVFYKKGTRLSNFYVRGISLSGPSWSLLDTGQHLQIKGNVEFDRFTLRTYDYLNFLPLHINYGRDKKIDMPGVEVLDQLQIPVLSDAFPFENRYISYQLYQRGNQWGVLAKGFDKLFPRNPRDFLDEWTIGFDFREATASQNERDIIKHLTGRPAYDYFDHFTGSFDHVSHHNNDVASRLNALKELDRTIGRIWIGIQASPRADETALILISDHGINSDERVYSQGFNILRLLSSSGGGGHHVTTARRQMRDYSIKGANPFVRLITSASSDSYYLNGQSDDYPTALVDFDGNERLAFHLRNNDLNILHILLQRLQEPNVSSQREAANDAFFTIIDRNRPTWTRELAELNEELDALHRWIASQQALISKQPKKFTAGETAKGLDEAAIRLTAQTDNAIKDEKVYREYARTLSNLLSLDRRTFDVRKIKIGDHIAKGAMGNPNSIHQLQNYVVGLSERGLSTTPAGEIDAEKSFRRVNYFDLLASQTVNNNVQPGVSNRPVDFIAARISLEAITPALPDDLKPDDEAVWLYGGPERQALILTRRGAGGRQIIRYLPVSDLRQDVSGKLTFRIAKWDSGFPLKIFEDENFAVPASERSGWLAGWHTEAEWLHATHKTFYSNAVIGLVEQFRRHPLPALENSQQLSADEKLLLRFRQRQRSLTETDALVVANDHWNFDVRGFNPGGNHGSFFRVSTNSAFMIAGGLQTGIPRGMSVEEPYDSLSFVPTVLALMGKVDKDNQPLDDLYKRGFRKFPGKIISELIDRPAGAP